LVSRDQKIRVYIHDWRASYLQDWFAVFFADDTPAVFGMVKVHAKHDLLAAPATRKLVRLGRIQSHPDADRVRLLTRFTLQRITNDHRELNMRRDETSIDGKQAWISENPKEPTALIIAEVFPFFPSRVYFENLCCVWDRPLLVQ
jgi:hypothetical protein